MLFKLRSVLTIAAIFFAANLYSITLNKSLNIGTKWSSNIDYLTLAKRLSEDSPRRKQLFINSDLELSLTGGKNENFTFDYSLYSDLAVGTVEFSELNHSAELSFGTKSPSSLQFSTSLTLSHSLMNYDKFISKNISAKLHADIFFDFSKSFTAYLVVKGGFYKGVDEEFEMMTGPAAGFEVGNYLYAASNSDFIKTGGGFNIFLFKDFTQELCRNKSGGTLKVVNSYTETFFTLEGEWYFKNFSLSIVSRYSYLKWLGSDSWNEWKKRRRDHTIESMPSLKIETGEMQEISIYYSVKKNISTIGEDLSYTEDYTDYNYIEHVAGICLKYFF